MRAFVTGITGFAGSYLAEHLLAAGDEVLGSSRHAVWPDELANSALQNVPLVAWDLAEPLPATARERIREFAPQAIYHLAAISVPADCGKAEPTEAALRTNVGGAREILELAASLPSPPRVLFVSSSYVYAVDPEHPVVTEDSPLAPQRAYGKTKLLAEREVLAAVSAGRLDALIARAFQHTGPRQSPRMLLPEWARQFARPSREPIQVQSLDAHLDLSDVRDVVRAYRLLIGHGQRGSVYNVGSGECQRSGAIFERLRQMYDPHRTAIETAPGRRQHAIADISRLQRETGWRPEIPLVQTISDTVEYWRNHERNPP